MVGRIFLGRYEAIRLLGEGGMGRVYLAKQLDLGRQVVIKIMHDHIAADPKFRDRFQRETLLMARFQHPYVVTLYDATLNDPQGPCIVMEYIRGITLDTLLQRNQRLGSARVGRLLGQMCEALQAAHTAGIIHRDLKPGNLMVVDSDTPYEKVKVMDFGLAKLGGTAPMNMFKSSGSNAEFAVGTPGYISPEQVRGEELDFRSDLYSLGVILFELLTGRLPFTGDETMDVLLAHATEAPPTFAAVGANYVFPAIESVVQACLAKNPGERPSSARDLAERYEAALTAEMAARDGGGELPAANDAETHTVDGEATEEAETNGKSAPVPADPNTVMHRLEAWMPDAIASYKLRGFVHDVGGEVLESVPGKIRVRLGGKGSIYEVARGPFAWFGIGRKDGLVDVELRLERTAPTQSSQLQITVLMTSPDRTIAVSPSWRRRCNQIYCDLRAYLAGASVHD